MDFEVLVIGLVLPVPCLLLQCAMLMVFHITWVIMLMLASPGGKYVH